MPRLGGLSAPPCAPYNSPQGAVFSMGYLCIVHRMFRNNVLILRGNSPAF